MNYEKAMIPITIIILVAILGIAGTATGQIGSLDLGEPFNNKQILPEESSDYKGDGYYQWCYKMGIKDC